MAKTKKQRSKGTGTLVLRGKTWFARWTAKGKIYTQTTGTSDQRQAAIKLAEFVAPFRLGGEVKTLQTITAKLGGVRAEIQAFADSEPATTISNGWIAYLDQQSRPDSGPVTLGQYEGWFGAFVRWVESKHPEILEIRQITQGHADAYAGDLLKRVSATTFNSHMNLLALMWRVLTTVARLSVNPWKIIGRKRFTVHSRRELTIEELQKVCETAQGEMRLLLALGIYCGLRLGDAACLQWGSVDMVKSIISLIPQKTARRSQKPVVIPIHRTLYAMLDETPKIQRKGYVMPEMVARHRSFSAALTKDVNKLFQSCGIETKISVAGSKRKRADCSFHSLRHTFVSLCAAGGVPQSVVQSLVGHGSPAMTQHYTHIGIETAQNAVSLLPDVTHAKGLPEAANAAEGEIEALQRTLERMTLAQLQKVAGTVKALIGKLKGGH